MFPIDSPGATPDKKFTEGDPVAGVPATVVSAKFMNDIQAELLNILAGTTPPTTPNSALQNQVITAIKALIAAAVPSAPADASETVKGILKLATQALTNARSDDLTAVTPLKLGNGFSFLATPTGGYIKLPTWMGGFIIQWITVTSVGTADPNFSGNWPMVFPTAIFSITSNALSATSGLFTRLISKNATSFLGTVGTYNSNTNAIPVMLLAVGN